MFIQTPTAPPATGDESKINGYTAAAASSSKSAFSSVPVKEPVDPAVWKARVTRLKSSELLLPQSRYGH